MIQIERMLDGYLELILRWSAQGENLEAKSWLEKNGLSTSRMKNGLLILIGLILVGGAPAFAQKSPAPDDARSDALQLILARLASIEERLNRLEKQTAPDAQRPLPGVGS